MEQAAEILKLVETPVQLAGLALLVLYAIAKALISTGRWTPSDGVIKLLLNRAYQLGLLALVLAVGGPLLLKVADRDDLIDGSVYAQDNSVVRDATVSAPPVGPQPVHLDGSFELRVPSHRRLDHYVVTASADGFKPETRTVGRNQIGSVDFKLEPAPIHAVKAIVPELVVGQFFGLPFVVVSLQTKSPSEAQVWINEISATLSSGPVTVNLHPQFVTLLSSGGPYLAVTGLVPINSGAATTIRFMMAPNANVVGMLHNVADLPEYKASSFCSQSGTGSFNPVTEKAFDIIQSYALEKFIWTKGDWTLRFEVTAGGQHDHYEKVFKLTATDVADLRSSLKLVKACQSVSGTFPLGQDGAMSNYVMR